jgi:hypothetical protein
LLYFVPSPLTRSCQSCAFSCATSIGAVASLQIWCTDCVPTAAMYFYNEVEWSTGGTGITSENK